MCFGDRGYWGGVWRDRSSAGRGTEGINGIHSCKIEIP